METISDGRAKHEFDSDFNSTHKKAGIETTGQLHEKDGQCSDLADVEATHWQSFSYERKTVFFKSHSSFVARYETDVGDVFDAE